MLSRLVGGFCAVAFVVSAASTAPAASASLSPEETERLAIEGYIYLYPLVLMDVTRQAMTNLPEGATFGAGPPNKFIHARAYPGAADRVVVRPNFDTLYSSAWLDLSKEPLVISAPATGDRYYLLPMLDMWSNVFAVPGTRTSGNDAASFAVVAPGWQGTLPAGVERVQSPTSHVWVIGRTQTNGAADYDAVHKVQDGYTVTPLSQWGGKAEPASFTPDPAADTKTEPMHQVTAMSAMAFFDRAAKLMGDNPPSPTDWSQVERLKRLGIKPGEGFDGNGLSAEARAALDGAPAKAMGVIKMKIPTLARVANGWQMNTDTMGAYGNYYLKRAAVALFGLGANQPEDAIYPMLLVDADGKPLTGDQKYTLHFEKAQIPPVDAFWSVTMYDEEGYQVANPRDRFAVGSYDNFVYGADGSLTLYIQHESPGTSLEQNWLPSPAEGKLGVTLRLYAPHPEALDGRWNPPAVKRVAP